MNGGGALSLTGRQTDRRRCGMCARKSHQTVSSSSHQGALNPSLHNSNDKLQSEAGGGMKRLHIQRTYTYQFRVCFVSYYDWPSIDQG